MASDRKILAQITDSRVRTEGWFVASGLPRELSETAARRLGVLALLTAATFLSFSLVFAATEFPRGKKDLMPIGATSAACAIALSLAIFAVSRRRNAEPRRLLDLGVFYQIAMAAVIGLVDNFGTMEGVSRVRGWSGVAVWIFIFAVFVPSTPRRTLWVSSIVALMDPLTLLVATGLGAPPPPLLMLPQMFAPTAVAVITALVASRVNFRMAKKLDEAREMGSYRLLDLLGKGGMGEVWRAEHRLLARPAAIKLIQAKALAASEESAEGALLRFEREAQATALLASEHTIEVYDFGIATNGLLYYVMELLDGLDLEKLVKTWGPMPPERVVHCLIQACDSLAEAHESGLVHRDIKPSNIFVCRRGLKHDVVKVLDFGLVKVTSDHLVSSQTLTAEHAVGGTPAYMVPEIIDDAGSIDGRADLYALGCVAYWCLSGRLVFEATSPMNMVMKHLSADPQPLSQRSDQAIPAALERIVHACLEKDPAQRPPSALDLSESLAAVELERTWTEQSARAWWQRHRAPSSDTPVDPTGDTVVDPRSLGGPQTSASSLADTVAQRPGKRSD